ncbi:MAG: SH3 domain-containing protein [Thermomicrobiales bacterium]
MDQLDCIGTMRGSQNKFEVNSLIRGRGGKLISQVTRLATVIVMFAMLGSGVLQSQPAFAAAGGGFRTTTPLNLRAEPSLSAKVLLIMPAQAKVTDGGIAKNGFEKVEYNGTTGWAFGDYLASTNPDAAPSFVGEAVTTSDVNLRQGPDLTTTVQLVVPEGSAVQTSDTVVDGFRYSFYNGEDGWIYDQYLNANGARYEPESTMKTTTALNLREASSTDSKVLLVMPAGAQVTLGWWTANGFRLVTYNGKSGWAYQSYLA